MYVVTAEEMRRIDRHTIEQIGIPAMVLMENAGREIAGEVLSVIHERRRPADAERWLVLAGKGNNGGDGFVAARHLRQAGVEAEVALAEPADRLGGDARAQYDIASRLGIRCYEAAEGIDWQRYTGVLDALLGTGTAGAPREPYAGLIREANASGLPIVAADIPSGLDADTGAVNDPCIRAERTVALAFLKRGLAQYPGAEAAGRVSVRIIGIPEELGAAFGVSVRLLTEAVLAGQLGVDVRRTRKADTHKGTYGHVLIAAGTAAMSGAGLLCVRAALRAGCGLATWALPASFAPQAVGLAPEAMLAGVADAGGRGWAGTGPEALLALAEGRSVLALGPGMGRWPGDSTWLRTIWDGARCPLVLDADALNTLADAPDFAAWPRRTAPTVLTPHPGEMGRLTGSGIGGVQRDRIEAARSYALEHGVTLVLKGARTVVAAPSGDVYINVTGNPGMSTGGAGDVLTGVIASLLAQGLSAEQAAAFGVYLHGAAGDRAAAKRPSPGSLLAGDIIDEF